MEKTGTTDKIINKTILKIHLAISDKQKSAVKHFEHPCN